jgi:phage-related protein
LNLRIHSTITSWSGEQQFYLMTYKEKIFLVDTQGYDYARYVIQLKGFCYIGESRAEAETMLMKGHPGSG